LPVNPSLQRTTIFPGWWPATLSACTDTNCDTHTIAQFFKHKPTWQGRH
jgi:hypothetical protein